MKSIAHALCSIVNKGDNMISFYSGTPGSGKSLEVAKDILNSLKYKRKNVISNIDIDRSAIYKKGKINVKKNGRFYYLDNEFINVDFFNNYAKKFHKPNIESQTLIVIDEAQMLFSPTVVKIKNQEDKNFRNKWLKFFTQHRKLGYDIILVSQFDRLIDAQVRCLFEYNVIHRKVNNFKVGWILGLLNISIFCSINYWYGVNEKMYSEFYMYKKKYSRIYNSYKIHDEVKG